MSKRLLSALLVSACGGSSSPVQPTLDAPVATHDAAPLSPDASTGLTRPPGVALCYSATAEAHPATVMFRAVFAAGDKTMRAASIDALDAAATALPNEEELQLFLGLDHLWRLAEPLTGEDAPLSQLTDATAARDHLKAAKMLCPTDARVDAWLGPVLVRFGRTLNDQATINEGLADLDEGIAAYPGFVLFSKLLVYADSARTAPEFQNALDAVTANIASCAQTPNDPACTNATVPHNLEGANVFLGDIYTKALRKADAQAVFTALPSSPGWSTWSFQALQTERMQDLDARIAAYSTTSTTDDPSAAWTATNQCALCHTH
jgi:hypothetical protein